MVFNHDLLVFLSHTIIHFVIIHVSVSALVVIHTKNLFEHVHGPLAQLFI